MSSRKKILERTISRITMTLILISSLLLTFHVLPVMAEDTIYIRSDGSVDPPTAPIQRNGNVYTLKDNIFSSIEVQRNNIVLEGNEYTLQGSGTGRAIYSRETNNVTIKNTKITGFSTGVHVSHSTDSKIVNNTITNCTYGILPDYSPNTTIINNTVTNNKWDGIFTTASPNTVIINNTVTNHGKWGIYLGYSEGSTLRKNLMRDNRFNFAVSTDFLLDVDTSNTADGKPIYYWINQRNQLVPLDAGYVAIVNSVDIVVKNLDLTRNGQGVVLVNSTNCIVESLNVTANGYYGIYLVDSDFNTIQNNSMARNDWGGIALISSTSNTVSNNTIKNLDKAIGVYESRGNLINNNTMKNNDEGPYLLDSSGNTFINNTIENNDVGIYLYSSNNNIFHRNNFVNNTRQVYNKDSTNSWDDGYPSGGNYWSDYTGMDVDGDGIGDTAYVIDETNQDNYPFMNANKKVWPKPQDESNQVELNPIFIAFGTATIIIVAILAYFLKNMRSKKHREHQKSLECASFSKQIISVKFTCAHR